MRHIALMLLLLLGGVAQALAAAQLYVSEGNIDMGTLYAGQKSKQVFVIENHGDETLEIKKIVTTCGCTSALSRDTLIAPGEATELTVKFDSRNFQGRVVKGITLYSNDPKGKTELRLRGNIVTELKLQPVRIQLGTVEKGQVVKIPLTLSNDSDLPVTDLKLLCTSHTMNVEPVPQQIEAGGRVELMLTVTVPKNPQLTVNGYVLISGQGHVMNKLRIPMTGTTRP
nr:DUF1573 domain-containing protein [uncultured Desulfuromonas sp.]